MTRRRTGQHTGMKIQWMERNTTIEVAELLGEGGEGQVYAINQNPELAVKIYHEHRKPSGTMAEKLSAMEDIRLDFSNKPPTRLPRVAWPTKIIKQKQGSQVTGIVMPMVDRSQTTPMSHILNPTIRKNSLPQHGITEPEFRQKQLVIAQNIIIAIKAIHRSGVVIGDVNDENILVNPATGEISIVDCDAFQITDLQNKKIHHCRVGREQFTAPELLNQLARGRCNSSTCINRREKGEHKPEYSCLKRQTEHDMFGMGVILFKLFMNNAHPYNQKNDPSGQGEFTLKNLISSRSYPYTRREAGPRVTDGNRDLYYNMPDDLKKLFLRTFN